MAEKINKSIEKLVEVLDCFRENKELGITEIANLTGYSKSTMHDVVTSMTILGLLEQDPVTRKYQLGLKLFEYGYLYSQRNTVRNNVKDIGRQLSDKYQATCHLATYDKNEIIYLDKIDHQGAIVTSYTSIGKRVPLTVTGLGKAMLAFLPEEYRTDYIYTEPLPSLTEYSITDIPTLEAELVEIKQNGYALDNQEAVLGLRCVACPIFDNKGKVVAALSISLLAPYFPDSLIPQISTDMKVATDALSRLAF